MTYGPKADHKVAILDLASTHETYMRDHTAQSLARRIDEAGWDVAVAVGVVDGSAEAAARLGAFVRSGGFGTVVLLRAWELAVVNGVRQAMAPGARLVRLSSGPAAALDGELDHVLDPDGLLALLGGGEPADVGVRRLRPADLRAARPDGNPGTRVRWTSLLDGEEPAGPPTISGPSRGCPYLADTRLNPHFAGLGLDPEHIQTHGCAFCLDNVGSYAQVGERETVSSWIAQIRRIRAERPEARELLLTDERPHPFLPAFFRALVAEPDLAPVELLVKSRVDWLLEHADGALAEAAALAGQGGHTLHVYLVGFESFEPFHLELFNKGVTVEDNVRAVARLRELEARFPGAFEASRLRCHGIVLFTPWTLPEHLLTSARRMRELRFHELRSGALRTRLRLYPGVPLTEKARADGLLADRFDPARPDRAAEQGYDASVPWRFAEPLTEAVFHAANAYPASERDELHEAELLELAVHFVLEWPALRSAPALAAPALRRALAQVGPREAAERVRVGVGEVALADPELMGVRAGLRRACMKEGVPVEDAKGLVAAYQAMGFHAGVVGGQGEGLDAPDGIVRPGADRAVIAVAGTARDRTAVLELQPQITDPTRRAAAIRGMGELMGYPRCCVDAFLALPLHSSNLELERQPFRRAPTAPLHPTCNRLALGARLVSHHLCTPDCAASIALGGRLLALVRERSPAGADRVEAALRRPVLFLDYQRQAVLEGGFDGDVFRVRSATATDPSRWPLDLGEVTAISLSAEGLTLARAGGAPVVIEIPRPLLVLPGEPLAPVALAAVGEPLVEQRAVSGFVCDISVFLGLVSPDGPLPVTLRDGWRLLGLRPGDGPSVELQLASASGARLHAVAHPRTRGVRSYVRTRYLALSYRRPDAPLPPDQLDRAMKALAAHLLACEVRAGRAGVAAAFRRT